GPALAGGLVLDERRLVAGPREDALVAQGLGRATTERGARGVGLAEVHDRHPQVGGDAHLVPGLGELADGVALALAQAERDGAVGPRVAEVELDLAVADPVAVVEQREPEGAEGHVPDALDGRAAAGLVAEGLPGTGALGQGDVDDLPALLAVEGREVEGEAVAVGVVV